jgi:hypothetical protein
MDIKRKTSDIQTWKKRLFLNISSINIDTLVPSLYQCVETCTREVFWLLSQPLPHLCFNLFVISETFSTQMWNALRDKHFFCPQETHNRILCFGSTHLNHGHHFHYWNQPLNMNMRVCYLDCHEAGLCYYLAVLIENLLCPLQLFYFHLWPIYWLSLFLSTVPALVLSKWSVTCKHCLNVQNPVTSLHCILFKANCKAVWLKAF